MASTGNSRWRTILDLALIVGSIGATIMAVGIVVALFVWVSSLPGSQPEPIAAPQASRPRPAPPAARAAPNNPLPVPAEPGVAPAAPAQAAAAVANAPPVAPAQAGAPVPPAQAAQGTASIGPNSDAAKNRAIGAGLARLAQDPEAQRKLGLGKAAAQP